MSSIWLQVFVSGLLAGGVYALISMGLTLIFGVMKIINFAHGEFLTLGMYAAVLLSFLFGLDPYVSVLIIVPVFFVLGMGVHSLVIAPLVRRGAPPKSQAIATLGMSVIIVNGLLIVASGRSVIVTTAYTTAVLRLGNVTFSVPRLIAFGTALLAAAIIYVILNFTYAGMAIRATAQDRKAAQLLGIPTRKIDAITFGLGITCVGVAGAIMVPFFYVNPTVGLTLGLVAYIVVVLGGLGSVLGAFVGGLLIGVVEAFSGFLLDPGLKELIYLLVFVGVLIFMPWGLFGVRGSEKFAQE